MNVKAQPLNDHESFALLESDVPSEVVWASSSGLLLVRHHESFERSVTLEEFCNVKLVIVQVAAV